MTIKRSMNCSYSVTSRWVLGVRGSQKVPNIMISDPGCVKCYLEIIYFLYYAPFFLGSSNITLQIKSTVCTDFYLVSVMCGRSITFYHRGVWVGLNCHFH